MIVKALYLIIITCLLSLAAAGGCFAQNTQQLQSPELVESRELNSSVMKLYGEGKYDEALPLAKRALELREKVLGLSDENLIPLLINLAEIYRAKKNPGETQSYLERSLEIGEKVFGAEDIRITRFLDKLAFIAYEQRNEKKAESLFGRSLTIKQKALGPDRPEMAEAAFNLGEIYRVRGDYVKAEPLYQKMIRIREKIGARDNSELVKALQSYVTVLFAQHKTDEGAQVQKRIAELLEGNGAIQGGVLNGRAVKLAQPPYPAMARRDQASGEVQVQVLIDENGTVIHARAMNAGNLHPALLAASEDAALHSLFTPTLLSGRPVKVYGIIIYRFVAQ